MAIQCVMFSRGELIGACVLVLSIGSYMYGMAHNKIIKGCLFAINRNAQIKSNRSHLFEQIVEFMESHANAKKLSGMENEIMSLNHISIIDL